MSPALTLGRFGSNRQTNLRKNLVCLSLSPEVPVVIGESSFLTETMPATLASACQHVECAVVCGNRPSSEFPEEHAVSRIVALRIDGLLQASGRLP
jgi:hypothetical protein